MPFPHLGLYLSEGIGNVIGNQLSHTIQKHITIPLLLNIINADQIILASRIINTTLGVLLNASTTVKSVFLTIFPNEGSRKKPTLLIGDDFPNSIAICVAHFLTHLFVSAKILYQVVVRLSRAILKSFLEFSQHLSKSNTQ